MLKFYFHPSPNPAKVALLLEELGVAYEAVPVDTRKGEQFSEAFLAINPNGKTPAMTDGAAKLFDSTAILLYLTQKYDKFLPAKTPEMQAQFLSWMMFVASGIGPYSGQAVHFKHFAPEPKDYAVNRYDFEAERHWGLIDKRLSEGKYMMGDTYTVLDMAVWGWARAVPFILGAEAWTALPNVKRLLDEINARPAAKAAEALSNEYSFKKDMDDAAKAVMFPQNKRLTQA
ncbi:MAG: glutathione S-transferase N-terminal domain-containing protein [Alphaproteobacteria bacterium]|nr:glutathione S-transferase N-terminal domain-containing protein [Alphaproteobacteria bacterium]